MSETTTAPALPDAVREALDAYEQAAFDHGIDTGSDIYSRATREILAEDVRATRTDAESAIRAAMAWAPADIYLRADGALRALTDWPTFLEWLANMRDGRLVISRFEPERDALPWHVEAGYGDTSIAAEGGSLTEALAELARVVTGGAS